MVRPNFNHYCHAIQLKSDEVRQVDSTESRNLPHTSCFNAIHYHEHKILQKNGLSNIKQTNNIMSKQVKPSTNTHHL